MDYFENAAILVSQQQEAGRNGLVPFTDHQSVVETLSAEPMRQPPIALLSAKRATTLISSPSMINHSSTVSISDLKESIADTTKSCKSPLSPTIDPSDFECVLCFRLFCKPVVTSCGHTFCKHCLVSALKFKPNCPLCRSALPKVKYSVNFVLLNVLEKHFKEDYEQREKEEEEELRVEEEIAAKQASIANESDDDWLFHSLRDSCLLPCCLMLSCST